MVDFADATLIETGNQRRRGLLILTEGLLQGHLEPGNISNETQDPHHYHTARDTTTFDREGHDILKAAGSNSRQHTWMIHDNPNFIDRVMDEQKDSKERRARQNVEEARRRLEEAEREPQRATGSG